MTFKDLLDSGFGSVIISGVLGFGLAALFQKACKDNNCVIIKGPPYKDIKDKIYIHDGKCIVYKPESSSCDVKDSKNEKEKEKEKEKGK
jgi:hypothetical protein